MNEEWLELKQNACDEYDEDHYNLYEGKYPSTNLRSLPVFIQQLYEHRVWRGWYEWTK